ncbi:MAG: TfoX/Sxy family protein [Candidatus Melainabacteria bacterium]|jgi:TfoX/Sxy family transcriptional regulator of competence genes|nr:TfoX/Sxy family protein [Candidatus Melainabacteria bacterium]
MPYSVDLEKRLDRILSSRSGFLKKKMFGGICFFLNGNMCVGVHKDFLILRVGKESSEKLLVEPNVRVMDITHKPMKGWVMVSPDGCDSDDQLQLFVETAAKFVQSLPVKT